MTLDRSHGEFLSTDVSSLWRGNALCQLYENAHTLWEWHKAIFDRVRELRVIPVSTPFEDSSVDLL